MGKGTSLHALAVIMCIILSDFISPTMTAPSQTNKQCGRYHQSGASREAKIVGGHIAAEGEFRFLVSFKGKHGHFCGGTVISDQFILSAAHCFYHNQYLEYEKDGSINLKSLNVTLGEYSLKNSSESSDVPMNLEQIHLHPKYDPESKQNDIALIKIERSIAVAPSVVPVCLPDKSDDTLWSKDAKATVVGWGKINFNQNYYDWLQDVDALRKVQVKIWDTNVCVDKYKDFKNFPSKSFLCAGEQGKESCTGDSGGPLLQLNENNKWVAVGIVANGNKCGAYGRPGVYTLVSDFLEWIESYTK